MIFFYGLYARTNEVDGQSIDIPMFIIEKRFLKQKLVDEIEKQAFLVFAIFLLVLSFKQQNTTLLCKTFVRISVYVQLNKY